MSAASTVNHDVSLVLRVTGKIPKTVEMNFLGTNWCFFTDHQDRAYWLHVPSGRLLDSPRNTGAN